MAELQSLLILLTEVTRREVADELRAELAAAKTAEEEAEADIAAAVDVTHFRIDGIRHQMLGSGANSSRRANSSREGTK